MVQKITVYPFNVFIVDDSVIIAERLKDLLKDLNFITSIGNAVNIEDAKLHIEEHEPKVVFLDINLKEKEPNANGISLLSFLRKAYPNMFIVMLTNLSLPQYKQKCLELGADYFYDKTNDFDKIMDTMIGINDFLTTK